MNDYLMVISGCEEGNRVGFCRPAFGPGHNDHSEIENLVVVTTSNHENHVYDKTPS